MRWRPLQRTPHQPTPRGLLRRSKQQEVGRTMAVPDKENHQTGKITESGDIPLSQSPAKVLPDFPRRFSGHSSYAAGLLQVVSVPTSSAQPSSSQPSSSTEGVLVPLNSDDVSRHPCLLTLSKIEETKAILTERVEFQTCRSLENFPEATRALKNAVVKISAESYEYWIFRSPESVWEAGLEPPNYSQPEKYIPKKAAASAAVLAPRWFWKKSFAAASTGPKKPRPKVTLGRNKAAQSTASALDQPGSVALPHGVDAAPMAADLQVTRAPTLSGTEKSSNPNVKEIQPLKRQKCPNPRGSTPVMDALREGSEQTVNLLEKIQTIISTWEAIRDLETDQVREMIAQNVLWAAENVVRGEVNPLKESLAAKNKKLSEKVQVLEGRVAPTEREVEAAKRETAKMNRKVEEDLTWRYCECTYSTGRLTMQREVHEALTKSLNEKDLATVMGIMPEEVLDPAPMPYADPTPVADTLAPARD
nr:serine/arginine repetitive matrix protein 2-like [Ipomoea batatas]